MRYRDGEQVAIVPDLHMSAKDGLQYLRETGFDNRGLLISSDDRALTAAQRVGEPGKTVERYKGSISIGNRRGGGTRFVVTIPLGLEDQLDAAE